MAQNYKIYHNGTPVFISSPAGAKELGLSPGKSTYIAPYSGKKKMLLQYLDLLDKNRDVRCVVIYAENVQALWTDFQSCFKVLEAAGGFVQNGQNQLLVFYRRGSWDMPKGKIDAGETPEQAAVREVQEETGLINLKLGEFIAHTYHTYEQNDKRILKKTWWYRMVTTDTRLVPQTEEDIEEIRWVEPKTWLASNPVVYPNIRNVVELGLSP